MRPRRKRRRKGCKMPCMGGSRGLQEALQSTRGLQRAWRTHISQPMDVHTHVL